MNSIQATDRIFVSASLCGTTIMNISLSGIESISDITRQLQSQLGGRRGLVAVNLRNSTRGWSRRYNFSF